MIGLMVIASGNFILPKIFPLYGEIESASPIELATINLSLANNGPVHIILPLRSAGLRHLGKVLVQWMRPVARSKATNSLLLESIKI